MEARGMVSRDRRVLKSLRTFLAGPVLRPLGTNFCKLPQVSYGYIRHIWGLRGIRRIGSLSGFRVSGYCPK